MSTMQIDRAVVAQALETIEGLTRDRLFTAEWAGKHGATITALRAALGQQAEPVQEPVEPFGYWFSDKHQDAVCSGWFVRSPCDGKLDGKPGVPLYTAPPRCPNCGSLEAQNTELDNMLVAMEHAVAQAAAVERKACADICDAHASCEGIAQQCAAAIRARGQA